jgi:hypothetical protein
VSVATFAYMRFEPSGMTNDPDIRAAKSIVDYISRWMGKQLLSTGQQEEIGILSPEVRAPLAQSYTALEGRPADAADGGGRGRAAGPDGAVQRVGGRARVCEMRRPDGADWLVPHMPRLRDPRSPRQFWIRW